MKYEADLFFKSQNSFICTSSKPVFYEKSDWLRGQVHARETHPVRGGSTTLLRRQDQVHGSPIGSWTNTQCAVFLLFAEGKRGPTDYFQAWQKRTMKDFWISQTVVRTDMFSFRKVKKQSKANGPSRATSLNTLLCHIDPQLQCISSALIASFKFKSDQWKQCYFRRNELSSSVKFLEIQKKKNQTQRKIQEARLK